jgi:GPH family glycoside/pentoside/hexuronide:cation symporter
LVTFSIAGHFFARPQDIVLLFILQGIQSIASGPTMPLLWSMMADAADYSEWKTGRRATALFYSASTLALKAGGAFGGALALWILAFYGYQANVAQSEQTLLGMRLMMSFYPAIGALVCTGLVFFYPLTEKQLSQIEKDLNERRQQRQENPKEN